MTEPAIPPTFSLLLPVTGVEAYAYHAKYLSERRDLYQPFTRDRIIQFAANVTAPEYAEALRQVNLLRREIRKTFSNVDLLITPTMPKPAQKLSESKNFDRTGLQNTSPFDILGLPAISIPCGFTNEGLPIGLQISGAPFAESSVMALAQAYERETEWHKRHPKLAPA